MDLASDREVAAGILAVSLAAKATRAVQRVLTSGGTLEKGDKSPVTVADFAAQSLVARVLAQHFPQDELVGEEDAEELRRHDQTGLRAQVLAAVREASGEPVSEGDLLASIDRGAASADGSRYWVLDPIDGTKGFLRRGQYAIALGLVEAGRVVLGVMGCPAYDLTGPSEPGLLLFARRGKGAFEVPFTADWQRDAVRMRCTEATQGELRFCESVESGHSDQGTSGRVASALQITAPPLRMDSQAKYVAVARGDAHIYMRLPTRADYREKVWDHAAGMILVEESGGVVTDVDGRPLDFTKGRRLEQNRGVLASCGGVHDELVAAVQEAMGGNPQA